MRKTYEKGQHSTELQCEAQGTGGQALGAWSPSLPSDPCSQWPETQVGSIQNPPSSVCHKAKFLTHGNSGWALEVVNCLPDGDKNYVS